MKTKTILFFLVAFLILGCKKQKPIKPVKTKTADKELIGEWKLDSITFREVTTTYEIAECNYLAFYRTMTFNGKEVSTFECFFGNQTDKNYSYYTDGDSLIFTNGGQKLDYIYQITDSTLFIDFWYDDEITNEFWSKK